jgi:UDP-glucose 4-epimerase
MVMRLSGASIVVTGGAGFIGSHVVDQLVAAGSDVLVIDDFSSGHLDNLRGHRGRSELRIETADVRDHPTMRRLLVGADAVIHMAVGSLRASLGRPFDVHERNATGTLSVGVAAQENGVGRFVYVSSSEAYGSAVYSPMDEEHPLVPTTVYGASKAAGELYATSLARTYGMDVTTLRPFNTYGPREHHTGTSAEVIPRFAMRALAGRAPVIFGDGRQSRDFTWVEDTARGIVMATASDAAVGQTLNLAHGAEVTLSELCDLVLEAVGRPDLQPVHEDGRPGDVRRHAASVEKAESVLGFRATIGIEVGVRRYVEWLRTTRIDPEAWAEREPIRNW